jgi:hypothetical protein
VQLTDSQYAAEKARVLERLEYWRPRLHRGSWRLNVEWERGENVKESQVEGWNDYVRFEIRAQWRYAQAKLYVWCGGTAELSDEILEEFVVHELCHCLVHELQDLGGVSPDYLAHEEHVATVLARAFIETRDRARDGDGREHATMVHAEDAATDGSKPPV